MSVLEIILYVLIGGGVFAWLIKTIVDVVKLIKEKKQNKEQNKVDE